ncbi:hypothetical protein Sjap_009811 [Stephania japonica]|uniref:Neutral ceramidase n=1 Tax=Stephania japonica TaxID=461633 RepID=A0AAP0P418_9MAGN
MGSAIPYVSNQLFKFICAIMALLKPVHGDYLIGVGSYDMTGPAAEVNMMGYANMDQITAGVHFRLRARAFIVAESAQGERFAFVNLDAGMASQLVTIKVLEKLKSRYGDLYKEENIAISGTHTHAGPGGYLQYVVYSITSLGDLENAGINRSPSAYLFNPAEERARFPNNVDTLMTLLKFVDEESNKSIGAFSWFATHGTSMSRENKLISGDNKGAAARFFEDWFRTNNSKRNRNLVKTAETIKATGGQLCNQTTSKAFKVRKTDGSQFVGAFCQSNVGDVSPNVLGAFCLDTGKPCDFNHSSCGGNDQFCVGRGPGYPDEVLSTKIIGERQFEKAVELFNTATEEITGKIDYRHVYLDFTDLEVRSDNNSLVKTCPAALGPGFAAGTTDGPGAFGFQQGDTKINGFWKILRNSLREPSQYQVDCQRPKTVLLDTGEMFDPYAWAPAILPIQILRLGNLIILSVPGGTQPIPNSLSPPDLSSNQISLLLQPSGDSTPPGINFGDVKQDVVTPKGGSFNRGERATAAFWSGNPRNDAFTEGTFAVVERLEGENWIPTYDDDDFCLYFKWRVDNSTVPLPELNQLRNHRMGDTKNSSSWCIPI